MLEWKEGSEYVIPTFDAKSGKRNVGTGYEKSDEFPQGSFARYYETSFMMKLLR